MNSLLRLLRWNLLGQYRWTVPHISQLLQQSVLLLNSSCTSDCRYLSALLQLLACIGEQFDEGQEICGVVVNLRARQDRLSVWTKTAHNEAAQVSDLLLHIASCENALCNTLLASSRMLVLVSYLAGLAPWMHPNICLFGRECNSYPEFGCSQALLSLAHQDARHEGGVPWQL